MNTSTKNTPIEKAPANLLASVDLGSNSFRLQICENHNGQLKIIDSLKQMVRFAAGLDEHKNLSEEAQERALVCLAQFGERLRKFSPEQVRVVATNTFRVAKNINRFITRAEKVLGFPIEVIAGREEARLIYTGVVRTLPPNGDRMLVVDIGGGSTEFIIGSDLQPQHTESLPLGCVTYSMRFFKNKISVSNFKTAIASARNEIQRISKMLKRTGWDLAIGTSGTAKAIRDVIAAENEADTNAQITYAAMKALAQRIIDAGSVKKAKLNALKTDRIEVFAGGLAVMMAVFEELEIKKMSVTNAALRDGVFFDFIGRQLNEDMRDQTAIEFQNRYHVSLSHAERVAETAQQFMQSVCAYQNIDTTETMHWQQYIKWAAMLHEIGKDIAHTAYHKHSAYILENADMPGFSRKEQHILSLLVLGHRGDIRKMIDLANGNQIMWFAIFSLRLATLFCRARLPLDLPKRTVLNFKQNKKCFILKINQSWLDKHPLVVDALNSESEQWQKIDIGFVLELQ